MKTNLEINFFGKIKKAQISLRPFTMIVGPNSSGKSFITKALYSIFHTMNKDLFAEFITKNINLAIYSLEEIDSNLIKKSDNDSNIINELRHLLFSLRDELSYKFEDITILQNKEIILFIDEEMFKLNKLLYKFQESLHGKRTKLASIQFQLDLFKININSFKEINKDFNKFYSSELSSSLKNEFLNNFLVQSIKDLQIENSETSFKFFDSDIGSILFSNNDLFFNIKHAGIANLQKLSNVVYLESPIYFKLRNTLNESRFSGFSFRRKGIINQVPKYFYDVDQLLTSKILSNNDENDLSSILELIEKTISGRFDITSQGEIIFSEGEKQIPFNMVSSGMANLGIIYLLVKKNVLTKGSYLIIDEPEINLHTEWQHIMMDILFELSKLGVLIVIASHSLDMVYRLENIISKNPQLCKEEHFSINRINKQGYSEKRDELMIDILKAKKALSKPYIELYNSRLP
ncbi:AAA family ATPase [Actinobacillus equuli]|uniref:AAA family ATPase n=1 Tax=Actinobacillus equuli TaxID=718 RepID=UPI002441F9D3|nr:AAA family ATPase [Actinobacillus equuli]WGE42128.1 ATP-binding protein [Actinobacillus equuli subsp. haemolyticus]